jgi:hypothetical protein
MTTERRDALIAAVKSRSTNAATPREIPKLDGVAFTCGKVAPMMRVMFPAHEQDYVLDLLSRSVASHT